MTTGILESSIKKIEWSSSYSWLMWAITLLIIFLVQLITIDDLMLVYKDQVQIIDYGRLILNPDSKWSLTWQIAEEKPILIWSYIGPLIAEMSYHLGGEYGIGSRIAALIGGMFAATMAFGWLKSRRVPIYAAYGLSIAFLIDPLFVLSQRIGRMDSWVIGLCLASCWILRMVSRQKQVSKLHLVLAGGLVILGSLTWPSAIFLYPLIFLELINQAHVDGFKKGHHDWKLFLFKLKYFLLGSLIIGVLLLIPIWENLISIFRDMSTMISRNVDASKGGSGKIFAIFDYEVWLKLIKAYVKTLSFFFPVLAIVAVVVRREKGLVITTLLTIAGIFATLVYELRALYLLPYFLVLSSGLFMSFRNTYLNSIAEKISKAGLLILVVWAVGISLLFKTYKALQTNSGSHQQQIFELANSSVGSGHYKVFLGFNYEFYFAGRSLDWQLYSPYVKYEYDDAGNWISESKYEPGDKFVQLLSKMDYAIFLENEVDQDLAEMIISSGLIYADELHLDKYKDPIQNEVSSRTKEIILWYLIGNRPNNSFILFSRKPQKAEDKLNSKPNLAISEKFSQR